MKKKKNTRYIVLGVVLLVAVCLGITVKNVKENRKLNFFEKAIKDSSTLVIRVVNLPFDMIKDKIHEHNEKNRIYKKYKKLQDKISKTELYVAEIRELQDEITALKEQLKLDGTMSEYTYIHANVINRNVSSWYNTLTIDKGSKKGIKQGQAVVVNQGLIGKIIRVSNFTSTVKLLTTDELSNKISVKVKLNDKSVYGLLSNYDAKCKCYLIEGISDSDEISENSEVVTTGLSESFPSGILIGHVTKVVMDEYNLTKMVQVKPSANFDDITIVSVLKREVAQ